MARDRKCKGRPDEAEVPVFTIDNDSYRDHIPELTAPGPEGHAVRLVQPLLFGGVPGSLACSCQTEKGALCRVIADRLVALGLDPLYAHVCAKLHASVLSSVKLPDQVGATDTGLPALAQMHDQFYTLSLPGDRRRGQLRLPQPLRLSDFPALEKAIAEILTVEKRRVEAAAEPKEAPHVS